MVAAFENEKRSFASVSDSRQIRTGHERGEKRTANGRSLTLMGRVKREKFSVPGIQADSFEND